MMSWRLKQYMFSMGWMGCRFMDAIFGPPSNGTYWFITAGWVFILIFWWMFMLDQNDHDLYRH